MDVFGIISILVIAIPVAMEVVEAALKKAGKADSAAKVRHLREMMKSEEEMRKEVSRRIRPQTMPKVPETQVVIPSAKEPSGLFVPSSPGLSADVDKPSIPDEVKIREDVKIQAADAVPQAKALIDKKKLIIYSEIMKPKFLGD